MRLIPVFILVLLFSYCLIEAQSRLDVPNFRIYPSAMAQTEPVITVSPIDPSFLFASSYTINNSTLFTSEGVYVSTDGGLNWFGSDTCTGALITNHLGDPGVMIDSTGKLILSHIGNTFKGVYTHYSTDLGATWSAAATVTSNQPEDKGSATMDNHRESPFYGRAYLAWVNYPQPVMFSYSTNSGVSWDTARVLNPSPPANCSGGWVTTARNGNVYVCWSGISHNYPFNEDFAGFASSTNVGVSWSMRQNIFDMNGIGGTLPSKGNIRVNGLPQIEVDNSGGAYDGYLYIVTTEINLSPAGSDPDIVLHRSTDSGATWSSGIRVNQDSLNDGKIQYFPAMAIDKYGGVDIIYLDDRNISSDSAEVLLARSMDAGANWNEYVISDHRFKPKPIVAVSSNYQGDHIALLANGDNLQALWMDDYTGNYQIWTCQIGLQTLGVKNDPSLPTQFFLKQNYPNPFNPVTKLSFVINHTSFITLTIFDVLGDEVTTLVNEIKHPGEYTVSWDASNVPSGVYLYRLTSGSFFETKKMVVVR